MTFTDTTTIFAEIYSLATDFFSAVVDFCRDVLLAPFPYSTWFRDTWAEFPILGNLFPGSNQFWYYAVMDEYSTAKVILILAVTFWLTLVLFRFVAKLVAEVIDLVS